MIRRTPHGVVVISVDVAFGDNPRAADRAFASQPEFEALCDSTIWLLELLDELCLPGTWFIPESLMSLLAPRIVTSSTTHEIGLLIGTNPDNQPGRSAFARNLQRQLSLARSCELEISSVAVPRSVITAHVDLLAKHGIAAVRHPSPTRSASGVRRTGWQQIEPLHFGVWNLPATIHVERDSLWRRLIQGWTVGRRLQRVAEEQEFCHIALDVGSIVKNSARRRLRRMLRVVSRLISGRESTHHAQALTMAAVAERLASPPVRYRAKSILQAA